MIQEEKEKIEIWKQMEEDHKRWKNKWRQSGSQKPYYEWLLENLERNNESRK